jgi:hypothetical protein
MDSFINNSLTFKIIKFLHTAYDSSLIMRFSSKMSTIYGFSIYSKIINRYMRQKSYAEKTSTYHILSRIGRFFDKIVGYFHNFLANCIQYSTVSQLCKTFISECKYNANYFVFLVTIFFTVGYSLGVTLRGQWNMTKLLYIIILGVVLCLSTIKPYKLKAWVTNSALYKLCQYIVE